MLGPLFAGLRGCKATPSLDGQASAMSQVSGHLLNAIDFAIKEYCKKAGVYIRALVSIDFSFFNNVRGTVPLSHNLFSNKAKRFAKQQRSNVISALACVHCYFLLAKLNGYQQQQQRKIKVVNSGGPL